MSMGKRIGCEVCKEEEWFHICDTCGKEFDFEAACYCVIDDSNSKEDNEDSYRSSDFCSLHCMKIFVEKMVERVI